MARRKPSENRAEEIEYRLLEFVRHRESYGKNEATKRMAAIAALAYLWKVDLGPAFREVMASLEPAKASHYVPVKGASVPQQVVPEPALPPVELPVEQPKKEPLTLPKTGGILDEFGD